MQTRKLELFTTIHTEGAVLPVDLLQRVLEGGSSIEGITPDSYHLGAGEKINEAVNRSWNRLQGLWLAFKNAHEKLAETETGTSLTREKWLLPLFHELGYGRLFAAKAIEVEGKSYSISHGWHRSPIHLVSVKLDLDKKTAGATGASKSSPHSLVQECLNASDDHLWGFVSNGLKLRILRDNKSITRQAFVEFDLESMMDGEVYSDFILLWMLCHQSRVEAEKPEECWLEKWSQTAQEQGTRALDQLRNGVEHAITELGQGFISHPANGDLREKLKSGTLSTQEYYRQLFRLVYRLLFLFVAEDRDLLLHPKATKEQRDLYNEHYSLTRLRRLASKIRGGKHVDAWEGARLVMDILSSDDGYEALGLPALGGYLFSDNAIPELHDCDLQNHDFLTAVRSLAFIVDKGTLRPVDYKNLRSEEFGSVYESLLELHPVVNVDAGTFELKYAGGNERKTTASYYTHDSLVQCLLDSALDPVIDEAVKKNNPEKAILELKICDPASGSGHFLTAAAHRMAKRLAAIRTDEEEPAPDAIRTALRDVIGHCIYGVDINPMAVELCKVALWMEALEAGKPLSFLDHHIQCGNSLIGADPSAIKAGIPDGAFKPIEGDDKKLCSAYKTRNKEERDGQTSFYGTLAAQPRARAVVSLHRKYESFETIDDITIEGVRKKEDEFHNIINSDEYRSEQMIANAWCASFVWIKTKDGVPAITDQVLKNIVQNIDSISLPVLQEIDRLSGEYQFFHWHLAFPEVFRVEEKSENKQTGWNGGFDVVLGNPPWDRPKPEPSKYFESVRPDISNALNANERSRMLQALQKEESRLYQDWRKYERRVMGHVSFLTESGRFKLTAVGKFNLGNTFVELARRLLNHDGRVGLLNVSGLATDDSGKLFIFDLMQSKTLVSFYDFENKAGLFPSVDSRYKFSAITICGKGNKVAQGDFVFFALTVHDLSDQDRHVTFTDDDILMLNPLSRNCPIFRYSRDSEIVKGIYKTADLYESDRKALYRWESDPTFLFVMSDHSKLFKTADNFGNINGNYAHIIPEYRGVRYLPLYESKMFHQYDHRWSSLTKTGKQIDITVDEHRRPDAVAHPRYWMKESDADSKLNEVENRWLIAVREVARATDERTTIATILPKYPVGHNAQVFKYQSNKRNTPCFLANVNSYLLDYVARTKVGGAHLSSFIIRQLPILPEKQFLEACHWSSGEKLWNWILPRVLELTYTAWDLQPFATDCGYDGAPFIWEEERRFLLRCELDAAYFHLYGIERDDVDYIMDTFPIVKRKDEAQYGEYRTKSTILEMYDQMKAAMESGREYQTWLEPPPADERVAHKVEK